MHNLSDTNLFADKVKAGLMLFCSERPPTLLLPPKGCVFLLSEVPVWSFTQNTKQPNATLSRLFSPPLTHFVPPQQPYLKEIRGTCISFFELLFQAQPLWLLKHAGVLGYTQASAKNKDWSSCNQLGHPGPGFKSRDLKLDLPQPKRFGTRLWGWFSKTVIIL